MIKTRTFFVILVLILTLPHLTMAAGVFNKNFIIADEEFFNSDGMTLTEVQKFLESKNSALAHYVATDVDGALRTAAEIIWRTGISFGINPKFFLVLLQKEQSLVEAKNLTQYQLDWATGYARCDSCSQDHPDIQDVKGLAGQIFFAGQWINKKYLPDLLFKGKTVAGFGPHITKKVDRTVAVKPTNLATSILYTYTPHIAGNKQLWAIWNKWFSPAYPAGSLLQDKKTGGVWLIEKGSRRPFASKIALTSRYDSKKIIQVDSDDLDRYPVGGQIKFANYSLLKLPDGKMYLVAGNRRREVISKEVMKAIGYSPKELINTTKEDIATLDEGQPITGPTGFPLGALFQDTKTGGVFFVRDGVRHPIIDKQILTLYWKGRSLKKTSEAELNKFTAGEPVGFKDNEIVGFKKTGQMYLISDSLRRPVTKEVLQSLGFDPATVIWTSEKLLALHKMGEAINFTTTSPEAIVTATNALDIAAANSWPEVGVNSLASDEAPMISTDMNENTTP